MATLTVPDELLDQIRAEAAHACQDEDQYALKRLSEAVARDAKRRAEDWNLLYGPAKSAKESFAEMRRKYNIPEYEGSTQEERDARADAALAKVAPEKLAEAERLGLIGAPHGRVLRTLHGSQSLEGSADAGATEG